MSSTSLQGCIYGVSGWGWTQAAPCTTTAAPRINGPVGARPCKAMQCDRAVLTRRKYVPVGSRSPSMATRRSAQPCSPSPSAKMVPLVVLKTFSRLRACAVVAGMAVIRPLDAMDGINEPTGTYLRRVVARPYPTQRQTPNLKPHKKSPATRPRQGIY